MTIKSKTELSKETIAQIRETAKELGIKIISEEELYQIINTSL